ncbi:transposase [Paenisporosarcina indica]
MFECEDCSDCPLKALCTKAKGNRKDNGTLFLRK